MSSKTAVINPSCIECGRKVGDLSAEEADVFYASGISMVCFDCEPFGTVGRPVELIPVELGTLNMLARLQLSDRMADEFCRAIAHARAHEHTRARGLSSYTNLNRNHEFASVLEKLYDDRICPGCDGLSFNHDLYGAPPCKICGDIGSIKVLKRWVVSLLGGVVENV